MADYCRFIEAAASGSDLMAIEDLRKKLCRDKDSFGVCLQALSYLQGLNLSDLILYDHSFVMKDDVVSIYLSRSLPDGMMEALEALEALDLRPSKKLTVAVQFGKLLKCRVQHGLDDVVASLDGLPAKDLYSRSIACLLRLNMCSLKIECKLRRRGGSMGLFTSECILDETGTSLCELLSRCCLILCIFGAERSNLFEDVKEVQETLLRLVPQPLMLHIIGAFAVVAFDNSCTFSLKSRRDFIESLATILPELLDRIILFNRIGISSSSDSSVSEQSLTDSSEVGSMSLNSTWSTSHLGANSNGIITLESSVGHGMDDHGESGLLNIASSYWEYAFGNVPRFRTLSLLLDFVLSYIKVAHDGSIENTKLAWLETLVKKPSFLEAFRPIFSSGDETNFGKILELSRILKKDIFVTDLVLGISGNKQEALRIINEAGPEIILSDGPNRQAVLYYMLQGIPEQPREFIASWFELLKPVMLSNRYDPTTGKSRYTLAAQRIMDGPLHSIAGNLLDLVLDCCMMQNFGDEPHPDDDNFDALSARQLLIVVYETLATKKIIAKLNKHVETACKMVNQSITLETVQILEFAIFCLWVQKIYDLNNKQSKLHSFAQSVNERTLHSMLTVYNSSKANDPVVTRLEALETLKKQIRADRLRSMIKNRSRWFHLSWLEQTNQADWNQYYADMGQDMVAQLIDAILAGPASPATPKDTPDLSMASPDESSSLPEREHGSGSTELSTSSEKGALNDNAEIEPLTEYLAAIKLLFQLMDHNATTIVPEEVYVTIVASMVHYDVKEQECIAILHRVVPCCPVPLLYRIIESEHRTVNIALMKVMTEHLDLRLSGVFLMMVRVAMANDELSAPNLDRITALMELVGKSTTCPMFFAEVTATEEGLEILQNFVVYVNGVQLESCMFLEARCKMNLALIEFYLQYEVPQTPVPVLCFVQARIKKLMEARAAKFEIGLILNGALQRDSRAAVGKLNTLDLIVTNTFQLFFLCHAPPDASRRNCWKREDNDLLHWSLMGKEHATAFRTASLLFKCFSQLGMTKMMFIAEHYIGVAARINGDKYSTARRIILSDDSMLKQEALEYLYQVYLNTSKKLETTSWHRPAQEIETEG